MDFNEAGLIKVPYDWRKSASFIVQPEHVAEVEENIKEYCLESSLENIELFKR